MSDVEGTIVADCVDVGIDIDAPPSVVFEFLVDPEKLLRWMGESADIDPTPGGRFWLKLSDEDVAEGEYLEIVTDRRVVFTWGWAGSDEVPPGSSTVTIDLEPSGAGTHVRLLHTDLPSEACQKHLEGWLYFGGRITVAAVGGDPDRA